jgi:hypothetical protein
MTTDTQPLAPTDVELMDLAHECELDAIEFGRAALAKWGTPVGAGEVVACGNCGGTGWMVRDPDIGTDQECFVCNGECYSESVTPQPTLVQAGAVPLTPDQVVEIADAAHREYDRLVSSGQCAPRWSAVFAHLLEIHHGIKGGQS